MSDTLQRFIFDETDIRGQVVQLQQSYQDCLANTEYPVAVASLLGEFLAAASLLVSTLKFSGRLTLQVRGDGPISMLMAESTHDYKVRAIAHYSAEANGAELQQGLGEGSVVITIEPEKGQRYQGMVPLAGADIAGCLEHYFRQSEQLETRLWLTADDSSCAGFMLQALPMQICQDEDARDSQWQHIEALADTLSPKELLNLSAEDILYRLFHQDKVRLLASHPLMFQCSCSRERTAKGLMTLGRDELESIIAEQGEIKTNCQFCLTEYVFDKNDIAQLYGAEQSPPLH